MNFWDVIIFLGSIILCIGYNPLKGRENWGVSAFHEQQYDKAFRILLPLAKIGFKRAQYVIGILYGSGFGTLKNEDKCFFWHSKAANKGFEPSYYFLGSCYYFGAGTQQNYYDAFKWFIKSANTGVDMAQYVVAEMQEKGQGVEQNFKAAYQWYCMAAEQGHVESRFIPRIKPRGLPRGCSAPPVFLLPVLGWN